MRKVLIFTTLIILLTGFVLASYGSTGYPILSSNSDTESLEVSTTGVIYLIDVEGGCWKILATDGTKYEPINLEEEYKETGLKVKFEGEIQKEVVTTCQVGIPIKLTEIEEVEIPEKEESLGSSCGTVTPGYQDECCQRKGYSGWDEENFTCVGEQKTEREKIKEANNLRIKAMNANQSGCPENCICSGSTIKCSFENGSRVMTVYAGNSGNVIVQIKDINMSTNVTLYKNEDKIYGVFNGTEKEIILPDQARDRIQNKTKTRLYNESVNLTEEGYYQIQAKKRARLFWIIPVREHVHAEVNAETGETIKVRNPWWGWLARDFKEEVSEEETQ